MIPDKVGKEPAAHAVRRRLETGGACLQVTEESCRRASSFLPRHPFQMPLFLETTLERKVSVSTFSLKMFRYRENWSLVLQSQGAGWDTSSTDNFWLYINLYIDPMGDFCSNCSTLVCQKCAALFLP